jgi:putative 4-mercaptohistidine N1-methyltranferase
MNPYETPESLAEYLLFHYGSPEEILPWPDGPVSALGFPVRVVHETFRPRDLPAHPRALDLGCAVGRSTFELTRFCQEVIGIDYSRSFVGAAETIARTGELAYLSPTEGVLPKRLTARLPDGTRPGLVSFEQGDALQLRSDLGTFDALLAANLLCRLTQPRILLDRLPDLVTPGGQLVIATPCTWLEDFTPRENWLGGFLSSSGDPVATLDSLIRALSPSFELLETLDQSFLIREHARKFQWSVALTSLWRRAG